VYVVFRSTHPLQQKVTNPICFQICPALELFPRPYKSAVLMGIELFLLLLGDKKPSAKSFRFVSWIFSQTIFLRCECPARPKRRNDLNDQYARRRRLAMHRARGSAKKIFKKRFRTIDWLMQSGEQFDYCRNLCVLHFPAVMSETATLCQSTT